MKLLRKLLVSCNKIHKIQPLKLRVAVRNYTSVFGHVQQGPTDPILGIQERFVADNSSNKVGLVVGAYRDNNGQPWILPSVKIAEKVMANDASYNYEYMPMGGSALLCKEAKKLAFGEDSKDIDSISSIQSLSGTGSLRVIFEFIAKNWPADKDKPVIHLPNPTWGAHKTIITHANLKHEFYPYLNPKTQGLDFNEMASHLKTLGKNDVVLMHAVAHNPTGVDPKQQQWEELADLSLKQGFTVLFDSAYQGFASGDLEKDSFALREFRKVGVPFFLAQSFAKNMGLYGQRCGVASIQCKDEQEKKVIDSQFKLIARGMYSNPPKYGGYIAEKILSQPDIRKQWLQDIKTMSCRILDMRLSLKQELANAGSSRNWDHITQQIGMFSFTGLDANQCETMMQDKHIYLTKNGRISIAGITTDNVQYIAQSIHDITK